ncbi:DUF5683 domain-containing protein [Mucilaginibacter sabulilitoris]|uniref:DUF5683 domain-containing protein n=1 Tax=Mucilaginibacter sabulilitoris TaxID=1173583 RepID=A0ABZ0TPP8_9SPHI|nr:DUF5683 domain-containing protein [Mucilaginibacter sabulilitoris]WPU95083.1 DUF5683 domain-containing protein [Mucilaginibacter sabulilitoris]
MYRYIFTLLLLNTLAFLASAQTNTDSLGNKIRRYGSYAPVIKEKVYHPDSAHKPYKAVIRSLFLPGLGQVYNRHWWKVPVIYSGIGLLGSSIVYNQKYYNENLALSRLLQDRANNTDPSLVQSPNHKLYLQYKTQYELYVKNNVSVSQAQNAFENHRRNRDLSIFGLATVWAINVIDAYIDAKFIHSFSVDNNLTLNPVSAVDKRAIYVGNNRASYNLGLKVTFTLQ